MRHVSQKSIGASYAWSKIQNEMIIKIKIEDSKVLPTNKFMLMVTCMAVTVVMQIIIGSKHMGSLIGLNRCGFFE